MNFDQIKKEMEEDIKNYETPTSTIDLSLGNRNPVQIIRSTMKMEIVTQLVAILFLFAYPSIFKMHDFSQAVYYIFMFLITLMTMGYIIKLSFFLKNTTDFTVNTKEAVRQFIFDTKLTLEVYKSFMIGGTLLIPIPMFAMFNKGGSIDDGRLFEKWFTLNINATELVLLIIGYLVTALLIYLITVWWAHSLYGKHLDKLEKLMEEITEEELDYA